MVIEQLWKRDTPLRKIRDSKCITLLQTYQPLEINSRRDRLWCHRLSTHTRWHTHIIFNRSLFFSTSLLIFVHALCIIYYTILFIYSFIYFYFCNFFFLFFVFCFLFFCFCINSLHAQTNCTLEENYTVETSCAVSLFLSIQSLAMRIQSTLQ